MSIVTRIAPDMISAVILLITLLLFLLITVVVLRSIISNHQIFGKPPVPVAFFLLAKILVVVNLAFLLSRGLNVTVNGIFAPEWYTDVPALVLLIAGTLLLFISTFKLNKDLIFGLSTSGNHALQTDGIFSLCRHPFYMGFIFILFSSCLFTPHYINILAFAGAWIIHHFIMIKEEEFLCTVYGDEYRNYAKRVKRYIIF